jgi:hypothetical protein
VWQQTAGVGHHWRKQQHALGCVTTRQPHSPQLNAAAQAHSLGPIGGGPALLLLLSAPVLPPLKLFMSLSNGRSSRCASCCCTGAALSSLSSARRAVLQNGRRWCSCWHWLLLLLLPVVGTRVHARAGNQVR